MQGKLDLAFKHYTEALAGCPIEEDEDWQANNRERSSLLHNLANLAADLDYTQQALDLWKQSLSIHEAVGNMNGKAAVLSSIAALHEKQGDSERAVALWREALEIVEKSGNKKYKSAVLNNIAQAIAKEGDVEKALELWNESLQIKEEIGDLQGKAVTLANIAWLEGPGSGSVRQRELNLESARTLASLYAWPSLIEVLWNLGASKGPDHLAFLAQALWLISRVETPKERMFGTLMTLVVGIGSHHPDAPSIAAGTIFALEMRRVEDGPPKSYLDDAISFLAAADGRKEGARKRAQARRKSVPAAPVLLSRLDEALARIVGDTPWLFDRSLFPPR